MYDVVKLSKEFTLSVEGVRRILKSKYVPSNQEDAERQEKNRYEAMGERRKEFKTKLPEEYKKTDAWKREKEEKVQDISTAKKGSNNWSNDTYLKRNSNHWQKASEDADWAKESRSSEGSESELRKTLSRSSDRYSKSSQEDFMGDNERGPFFSRDGESRSYNNRDGGERRSFSNRDGERGSYNNRDGGERRSFGNRDGERRSFGNRDGERRSFNNRDGDERRSFSDRDGDRRSFNNRDGNRPSYNNSYERRPFNNREDRGNSGSFNRREGDGDRPRRPFNREGGDDRPRRSFSREDGDRPRRPFNTDGDKPRGSFNKEENDKSTNKDESQD